MPVDQDQAEPARVGWRRSDKSRYRAGLNFGDRFAYALAKSRRSPLLPPGEELARTDIEAILPL